DDNHNNVVVFLRKDKKGRDLLCAVNFSPNTYEGYRMGVPDHKQYVPVFNTDAAEYGGDGFGDTAPVPVEAIPSHGKERSAAIRIPAFGAVFLRGEGTFPKPRGRKKKAEGPAKAAGAARAAGETAVKAAGKTAKASAKALAEAVKEPKRRGRPPKVKDADKALTEAAKEPKRRGRPPKAKDADEAPAKKPRAKKQAKELKET
ncbi:alpha amylase C-terminal domain-containing protein, partial [uncultured Oscillibacter sp.]|uniref:alpha amylase C-terminal domain-containing protein n=1 Tax=uncultured Oscillibacter sp. TaxID=876091 RepID=UPI0025D2BD60